MRSMKYPVTEPSDPINRILFSAIYAVVLIITVGLFARLHAAPQNTYITSIETVAKVLIQ